MALSDQDRQQLAAVLASDPKSIDWKALLKQFGALLIEFVIEKLSQLDVKTAKTAGCPDDPSADVCCGCARAACLALQSAQESLKCAGGCCQ